MNEEEFEKVMYYSEKCAKLAEVNVTLSSIGLLSTIIIDGKAPAFSLVMCGVCGVMLSYNAYNMYNLEKIKESGVQKVKTYKKHNKSNQ